MSFLESCKTKTGDSLKQVKSQGLEARVQKDGKKI